MNRTAIAAALPLLLATTLEAQVKTNVTFDSNGSTLAGHLYLPADSEAGDRLPAVVVTGAWTTVKEQMPAMYAAELAARGFAALTFDFRGWGESPDGTPFLESPERKTADIAAAFAFLRSRPEVDSDALLGLGICASSGYMSDAVNADAGVRGLALVAPWLHDAGIVEAVYGGAEGVRSLIAVSRDAEAAGDPVLLEAASTTNENAVMFGAPYYTEPDRGLIPEYDNQFNAASWEPWLTYDAVKTADELDHPTLLVHSESAAIPQGAREYGRRLGEHGRTVWLEEATQFDFYDSPEVISAAMDAVASHFSAIVGHTDEDDRATVEQVVSDVAFLADAGDFDALERLYAPEVVLDYSSLSGVPAVRLSREALMTSWAGLLPGFDETKHEVAVQQIEIYGPVATVSATVTAAHALGGESWTVAGRYDFRLSLRAGAWEIIHHTFHLEQEEGDRALMDRATERAQANPVGHLRR